MKTVYEWCAERLDGEDIVDHRHADRLRDLWPVDDDERLCLVRDTGDDINGLSDRMWAYADNRMLPSHFTYCGEGMHPNGFKVPQRFHREIARI